MELCTEDIIIDARGKRAVRTVARKFHEPVLAHACHLDIKPVDAIQHTLLPSNKVGSTVHPLSSR